MPVTTRYSATFDRTYEEEDRVDPSPTPTARRSRSQSWQANSGLDGGRPYTPLGCRPPTQRSSSTDNGSSKFPEHIPTRTVVKTAVKAHNNPFQFVKVGTCPLYKKAEEQLKKAKEVKKPDVLKEEEEEWQSNLDSWKSRRRKMSEDVFRRAEEVRQFELEEQNSQVSQKKTKTFSEMVEQRATRGRALSLCLISSPMELQNWEFEGSHKNGSCSTFSGESEENSTVNSEDEGVILKGTLEKSENGTHNNSRTNGDAHIEKNGSNTHNGDYSKLSGLENNLQIKPKEGSYIDSGLESISSHRAGDTPDSGSDFSHDSGSSMDCESPRTGVNILEEFNSKSSQISSAQSTTSDTANGVDDVGKKSEISVKVNKSEVLSPKTESLQYERSIESENEMFVDDYEELQRQSELLAASSKSEAHAEANGNIAATSVKDTIPNITLTHISPSTKQMSNDSVEMPIKTEQNSELSNSNQSNGDIKVKNKTRRKGVYALNVSAAPNEISKEGNSINFLFPLSPVTELPSPEDAKTMASTLSSKLTSVPDSKKDISREVVEEKVVEHYPDIKEKCNHTTVTEDNNSKEVSTNIKAISPKVETKPKFTSLTTVEKSKESNAVSAISQNEKPKLVLKKIKIKPKKGSCANEKSKILTSSAPPSTADISVKIVQTINKDSKLQSNEKQENTIKSEDKPKELSTIMVSSAVNKVTETEDAKNVLSEDFKNISKEEKKTDFVTIPLAETTVNNTESTSTENLLKEKSKLVLSQKKIKPKTKKGSCANEVTKEELTSSAPSIIADTSAKNVQSINKDSKLQNNEKQENTIKSEDKPKELSKIMENASVNKVTETGDVKNVLSEDLKNISKDEKKTDFVTIPLAETTVNNTESTSTENLLKEKSKLGLSQKKIKPKTKKGSCANEITKEVLTSSAPPITADTSVKNIQSINKDSKLQSNERQENTIKSEDKPKESSKIMASSAVNKVTETEDAKNVLSDDFKNISKDIKKRDIVTIPLAETTVNRTSTATESLQCEKSKPELSQKKMKPKTKGSCANEITKEVLRSSIPPIISDTSLKIVQTINKDSKLQRNEKQENTIKSEDKPKELSKIMESALVNKVTETDDVKNISKDEKKTDFVTVPLTETIVNNVTSMSIEGLQSEKSKPGLSQKKIKPKIKKENSSENTSSSSKINKLQHFGTLPPTDLNKNFVSKSTKDTKSNSTSGEIKVTKMCKDTESSTECKLLSTETSTVAEKTTIENKTATTSVCDHGTGIQLAKTIVKDDDKTKSTNINVKDHSTNSPAPSISNDKKLKISTAISQEKVTSSIAQKKKTSKLQENDSLSLATKVVSDNAENDQSQISPSTSCDNNLPISNEKKIASVIFEDTNYKKVAIKSSVDSQDENQKSTSKKKTRFRKKNANSQKVNTPAKQIEECKNLNVDSLNIVYQSEPKHINSENQSNVKNSEIPNSVKANINLVHDVPPVEKVAEEMEKLILEQLEEEERAKELASGLQIKSLLDSSEHLLTAPPKLAEPPKEKPPPPPANEGNQKETSLKRVNSTKRIKKEIYKRRSNFLGIDNADENLAYNESSIPPPPALEEILKAEMELDRQGRLKIEIEATERLTLEEKEIMQKEREIIESLESEERQKQLINCSEDFSDIAPNNTNDVISEEERILLLKNEHKRLEAERLVAEEQQLHIIEEKQLKEREEFIRKQEGVKSAVPHSDNSLSVAVNVPNTLQSSLPPLSTDSKFSQSLPSTLGDGISLTSISAPEISKKSENDKGKIPQKPIVPPKPLKKKEVIRKERERLRQEQEALQREREEHRRKLMQEQEELLKQKSHAPEASVSSQLGPLPPLVPLPLTTDPQARDSASFSSRSHHGAPNGAAGNSNSAELMGPAVVRQKMPPQRKVVQNEAWGQQKDSEKCSAKSVLSTKVENLNKTSPETSSTSNLKECNIVQEEVKNELNMNNETGKSKQKKSGRKVKKIVKKKIPSVRKQNQDSLTESRYNQNHWLIQEAEMRRIAELKERQRTIQLPCSQTNLAEDDVCSNSPRIPVITPSNNQHMNYHAVQDKMWNYASQSNVPIKKYPPPVVKEPLHTIYPRDNVSQQPPMKPSRVVPMERQEQMLSVSGRKRCSHCNEELGRGAAMIIESLQLYYHINCFQCCVCHAQLGNGSCGTDVRVRNQKLHCHNCYSNDEAGLKFSQV